MSKVSTKGKKELPEYEENPSIPVASNGARIGTRKITNKTGDKCMIVSDTGEVMAPAGFYDLIEVDQTQFVKFYVNGVKLFNGLSAAGTKVFEILYKLILKNPNMDRLNLHPKITRLSRATFDRGIVELLNREIIYKSVIPFVYYININYVFNGDRLRFIKEYRLKAVDDEARDFIQEELPL